MAPHMSSAAVPAAASGAAASALAWAFCVIFVAAIALDAKTRPLVMMFLPRGWQRATRSLKRGVQRSPPEVLGATGAFCLVLALRCLGPLVLPHWVGKSREGADVWATIQNEWPLLSTADTLLAMQSMLRPIVVLSAMMHAPRSSAREDLEETQSLALSREGAMLWVFGIVARCVTFPLSGDEDYMIIGPAGGIIPVAFDIVTLTLLFCFLLGTSGRCCWAVVVGCFVVALVTAHGNNLGLNINQSDSDPYLTPSQPHQQRTNISDWSFAFAHALELFASAHHLAHLASAASPVSGACRVTIVLVLQQLLSSYFFVNVFPMGDEEFEAAQHGRGLTLITGGSIANLGLLLLALAACVVNATEAEKNGDVTEERPRRRRRAPSSEGGGQMQPDPVGLSPCGGSASGEQNLQMSPECKSVAPSKVLEYAIGVPQRCHAHACLVHAEGLMHEGESLLEITCTNGCCHLAHARCFRASSRAVRRHCGGEGCEGQVTRFWAVDGTGLD